MFMKESEESKIISLEDDVDQNFVLRSPPRGKLYRGPNWNAFCRESLGSIPRNNENILFKDKLHEKIGFSSQTGRFNKKELEKSSYPGPGKYSGFNSFEQFKKSPSFSNKGCGGFISTTERFDSLKESNLKQTPNYMEFNDKIYIENKTKTSKMFKSFYNLHENKTFKKSKVLGNGLYNSTIRIDLNKDKNLTKDNFFISKNRQRLPIENITLSPGHYNYFLNESNSMNFSNMKNCLKTSYFFKGNIEYKDESSDKYLGQKKYAAVGNHTNIDLSKMKNKVTNIKMSDKEKEKHIFRLKELDEIEELKEINREPFLPYVSPFENNKKSSRALLSKIRKDDYNKSINFPVASNYPTNKPDNQISFNFNPDKISEN